MSPNQLRLPPERELPPGRHLQLRHRVLQPEQPPAPARLRRLAPVASAAAVLALAAVLGGVLGLRPGPTRMPAGTGAPATTTPSPAGPRVPAGILLRNGPLTAAQQQVAVRDCLRSLKSPIRPQDVTVMAAHRLWTRLGIQDDIAVRDRQGVWIACTGSHSAGQVNSKDPAREPVPSAAEPLVSLTGGSGGSTSPDGRTVLTYDPTQLFRVSDRVARVQLRIVTSSAQGPWYEGVVVGGYAHVAAWLSAPMPNASGRYGSVRSELRAFDRGGRQIATPWGAVTKSVQPSP
jgi:hypothetical protein